MPDMHPIIKNNWAIVAFIFGLVINAASAYIAVQISISKMDTRITSIEERQNRQGETIRLLQQNDSEIRDSIARLETNVSNMKDDVNYIRDKLDRVFP